MPEQDDALEEFGGVRRKLRIEGLIELGMGPKAGFSCSPSVGVAFQKAGDGESHMGGPTVERLASALLEGTQCC